MRAHMCTRPAHRRRARTTADRARTFCCCCCCCCCRWHAPPAYAAAAPPIPPEGPQPPGATSESPGGSNPCVPSFARHRAHTTSERARSPLPGLGQASRGFLSASGAGDAQGTAKHGQQAKDSRTTRAARLRNVRQRAPIRKGRSVGGTKGHVRVEKGIGMGCFGAALPYLVPGQLLVGQQHHLRQEHVDRTPQTVVVVAD